MALDPLFVAWLAGFTDGEGYMDLDGTPRVVWTNTHLATLERIQGALAGGTIRRLKHRPRTCKPIFQLTIYGRLAREVLGAMRPHLSEKRAQADLILSYTPAKPGHVLTDEERAARWAIHTGLKELRHARS